MQILSYKYLETLSIEFKVIPGSCSHTQNTLTCSMAEHGVSSAGHSRMSRCGEGV